MESGALLVPIFTKNVEEMRWNPFFYCWNLLGLSKYYNRIIDANIPYLSRFIYQFAIYTWFFSTCLCIPIPVKVTTYIGDPVSYDMDEHAEVVRERAQKALQNLINQHQQNTGKNYYRALSERFPKFFKQQQKLE
jgi:hypothetical protein